jgi:hypothetical protein
MSQVTRANAAQTAANAAATLFQGTGNIDGFGGAIRRIADFIVAFGEIPSDDEMQSQAMARAEQNLAQAGIQATVARDLSNDALIDNPNDWYNNVGDVKASSGGGIGPDYRHKTIKGDNGQNLGLWLNGKYGPAPAWVFEKLGLSFPGSGAAQPAAQTDNGTPAPAGTASTPIPF